MDFIDLPSIFRDKSVQSSIPNYFKNYEVPIICYKYHKTIRGAIFNFNKPVSDLDNIDVLRETACLVVNPIKVNSFAYLFNCTTVGRASD